MHLFLDINRLTITFGWRLQTGYQITDISMVGKATLETQLH